MDSIDKDLMELINAMTQSEKRYFQIYGSQHVIKGRNSYMNYFEHLEKKKKYDIEKIRKAFAGEAFLNWMASMNKYLYSLILKSLRAFHSNKTASLKARELLECTKILYDKGLYRQGEKLVSKSRKIAHEYNMPLLALESLSWEYKTNIEISGFKEFNKDFYDNQKKHLHEYENYLNLQEIFAQISYLLLKEGSLTRASNFLSDIESIMKNPLLKNINNLETFYSKHYFYTIYNIYYRVKKDFKRNYESRKTLLDIWNNHPLQIQENTYTYVSVLFNFILGVTLLKRFEEALRLIQDLRKKPFTSLKVQQRIFIFSHDLELDIYYSLGDFQKAIKKISYIEEKLHQFPLSNNARTQFYFQIAKGYFCAGSNNKSLIWVNKILNDYTREDKVRLDIFYVAILLSLLLHYEKGNEDFLEYLAKSRYQLLNKKERIFKFETLLFNFLKKTLLTRDANNVTAKFKKFRLELVKLRKDNIENKVFEYFDFITWADSKITGKTMEELIKNKKIIPQPLS